jgi:hypothetical protein
MGRDIGLVNQKDFLGSSELPVMVANCLSGSVCGHVSRSGRKLLLRRISQRYGQVL